MLYVDIVISDDDIGYRSHCQSHPGNADMGQVLVVSQEPKATVLNDHQVVVVCLGLSRAVAPNPERALKPMPEMLRHYRHPISINSADTCGFTAGSR